MRFRLLELFGLPFVAALGLGALARSGTLLEPVFFSLTLGLLLAAVLLTIALSGERRFYWIGFAIAGIAYLWCVSTPVESSGEPFTLEGSRSLVTTRTL